MAHEFVETQAGTYKSLKRFPGQEMSHFISSHLILIGGPGMGQGKFFQIKYWDEFRPIT